MSIEADLERIRQAHEGQAHEIRECNRLIYALIAALGDERGKVRISKDVYLDAEGDEVHLIDLDGDDLVVMGGPRFIEAIRKGNPE